MTNRTETEPTPDTAKDGPPLPDLARGPEVRKSFAAEDRQDAADHPEEAEQPLMEPGSGGHGGSPEGNLGRA